MDNQLALLTHRLQDMRTKMKDLIVTGERAGLKVNSDKTKMMNIMSTQSGEARTGQNVLEKVEGYQYLGSIINTTGSR